MAKCAKNQRTTAWSRLLNLVAMSSRFCAELTVRKYIFSDESGDLVFTRTPNVSQYFILCTVCLDPSPIGQEILHLRRDLAWRGLNDDDCLHASTDPQAVRNEVFALLNRYDFRIDATILEKSKSRPQIRISDARFYHYAWFYHFKHIGPRVIEAGEEAFIAASAIGTGRMKSTFRSAIHDVARQVIPTIDWRVSFWPGNSDPCLLVADYCSWALQRKWEKSDTRSYDLIRGKVVSEFDLWARGGTHYY